MVAASSFKLLQYLLKSEVSIQTEQWITLGIGFITSFFVALAVIAWFMQWVKARGFVPFAIYRIIAGALILFSVLS
jgi:undecaprenyl-diphosphatase